MERFDLKRSIQRVVLLSFAFCILPGQAFGQPPAENNESVESALADIAKADQKSSFKKAHAAAILAIRADKSKSQFVRAVLVAKLMIAVEKRASLLEPEETSDGLEDLISLGSGDIPSTGSLGSGLEFDTEKVASEDSRSIEEIELKRHLDKVESEMTRAFFVYYRTNFAGDDQLQSIFEKVTDDKSEQRRLLHRYLSEFKEMDKRFSVIRGKLWRK